MTLAGLLAMTACSKDKKSSTGTTPGAQRDGLAGSLQAHQWILDPATSDLSATSGATVTLGFDADGRAAGKAPCNTYHAGVTVTGNSGLTFSDIASTQMGCAEDIMAAEQAYLTALGGVTTADASETDRLTLTGEGVKLTFVAANPQEEVVGTWTIVNLNTTKALTGPVEGTEPTITFNDDASVLVTTGCNNLSSTYSIDGDSITFTEMSQTMMACEEPAGVMDQEQALGAAVAASRRIEVAGNQLTLFSTDGSMMIIASRD